MTLVPFMVSRSPKVTSLPRVPGRFTLTELQRAFEKTLGRELDKRNFRKFLRTYRVVEPLKSFRKTGRKPARLHRYTRGLKRLVIL